MGEVILGLETEVGSTLKNSRGTRVPAKQGVGAAMNLARQNLPCWLRDTGSTGGIFLGNGGRLYIDGHLEYATPETTNPADLVRHALAGDRFIESVIIPGLVNEYGFGEAKFYRSNGCYFTSSTKGCHENYGTRNGDRNYVENLLPHLCSRIVYSGSGGFNACREDIQFLLSPRVAHIETVVSESSTGARPLFHTKNESHSGKGRRLHIICGDSGRSPKALYRRVGMTGLVVALIDAGFEPGKGVELLDPLGAVRTFAEDPFCTAEVPLQNGGEITAKGVQFHYLQFAESHFKDLPDWAPELCADLRLALEEELKDGAATAARDIEWAMKHRLYSDFAAKRGFSLAGHGNWDTIMRQIVSVFKRSGTETARLSSKQVRSLKKPPKNPGLRTIEATLQEGDRSIDELVEFLEVRNALFELDTRWTEIGEESLFNKICRAAGISESIPGLDPESVAADAINTAPTTTRAHIRGSLITDLGARDEGRRSFRCNWDTITDHNDQRVLSMSDPFEARIQEQAWTPAAQPLPQEPSLDSMFVNRLNHAMRLYDHGALEQAANALGDLEAIDWMASSIYRKQYLRYAAWVHIRRGSMEDARAALDMQALLSQSPFSPEYISDCILVHRHAGLRPADEIRGFLAQGMRLLHRQRGSVPGFFSNTVYSHLGYYLAVTKGKPERGLHYLRKARQWGGDALHPFPKNRLFCDFARAFTMLRKKRNALYWLYKAKEICDEKGFKGEYADFVLAGLARIHRGTPSRAMEFLEEAQTTQRELSSRVGEARTLLLQSRINGDPGGARRERLLACREGRSVLERCGLLTKILDNWEAFAGGGADPEGIDDDFWSV